MAPGTRPGHERGGRHEQHQLGPPRRTRERRHHDAGDTAGDGRCEAGQWGVAVEDVIAFGSLTGLRRWAQSILDQLPEDRDGKPLVIVDGDRQWAWAQTSTAATDPNWSATAQTVCDLVQAVAANPAAVGWSLGHDVAKLWAGLEDDEDLIAGVTLLSTGQQVGIGEPLTDADVRVDPRWIGVSGTYRVDALLSVVAARINAAY